MHTWPTHDVICRSLGHVVAGCIHVVLKQSTEPRLKEDLPPRASSYPFDGCTSFGTFCPKQPVCQARLHVLHTTVGSNHNRTDEKSASRKSQTSVVSPWPIHTHSQSRVVIWMTHLSRHLTLWRQLEYGGDETCRFAA